MDRPIVVDTPLPAGIEPEADAGVQESVRNQVVGLYPQLRRFAAVVTSSDGDPDDLVQDAVERLLRRRRPVDDVGAFLRRCMVNLESNRRRGLGRLRRARARLGSPASGEPASYPSDLSVLTDLSPLDRSVIFLLDVEGWPSKDVASHLELTDAAVRTRATRARATLRNILENRDD